MLNLTNNFFKFLKKSAVVSLCTVMTIVAIPGIEAFADELNANDNDPIANNERDLYSEKFEETVSIEGISYTYKYYYNEKGDRSISILNNEKSTVETITYDDELSAIYSKGKKIAEIETIDSPMDNVSGNIQSRSVKAKSKWKLLGTRSKTIQWHEGLIAASLAAIIAIAIGTATTAAIIASCGVSTLGVIAAFCTNGTLYWTSWNHNTQSVMNFKHDWAFKAPTGRRYGTYHAYHSLK